MVVVVCKRTVDLGCIRQLIELGLTPHVTTKFLEVAWIQNHSELGWCIGYSEQLKVIGAFFASAHN